MRINSFISGEMGLTQNWQKTCGELGHARTSGQI